MQTHSVDSAYCSSDSWTILSGIEQTIKQKVEAIGTPLKDWDICINYGIKTGFNDAFIISSETRDDILSKCLDDEERNRTAEIIRPILRGRDIKRYGYNWPELWIINTHNGYGEQEKININLYPAIKQHLDNYLDKLSVRSDKGDTPYNLRNCAYVDEFSKPKIVWGNLNTRGSYAIAPQGMFINAPACMIVPGDNYLLAHLNSKIADYYIRNLGVVRNGGFFEYKPMFVEQIPVPKPTGEIEQRINEIFGMECSQQEKEALLEDIIESQYGFTEEEITFLRNQQSQ